MSRDDYGDRLPKSVDIRLSNRPMKVAFLVPIEESATSHWILDGIFSDSYTRWGGARSLLIPFHNGDVTHQKYNEWLAALDPDFIYSYVDLTEEKIEELNHLALPMAFLRHQTLNADRWRGFVPDWSIWISPVSSISTLTSPLANYRGWSEGQNSQIYLTQHSSTPDNRFFPDNFGVAFSTNALTYGHAGVYETMCYAKEDLPEYHNVGNYKSSSINELLSKIARSEVKTISKLATIHANKIPRPSDYKWNNSFQIIIGESILDRLNFWNVRHFSIGWTPSESISSLIVSPDLINDLEFCKSIGEYLNKHNFLGQNNGPSQVSINSYSIDQSACSLLMEKLTVRGNSWNNFSISSNFAQVVLPETESLKQFRFVSGAPSSFKASEANIEFNPKEPEHFQYIPTSFLFAKRGQWVSDLQIERHADRGKYVNVINDWKLPRRLEVVRAFTDNRGKINASGHLSLIPSSQNNFGLHQNIEPLKIKLNLPEDAIVFRLLVAGLGHPIYSDYRNSLNRQMYEDVRLSDKGQNHRGVVSKFENVQEAASILTNLYWRNKIRIPKDSLKIFSLKQLVGRLNSLKADDVEHITNSMRFDGIRTTKNYLIANLKDVLELLVHNGVMLQTHSWRCEYCGSRNKRGLELLSLKNNCDICKHEYECPIDFEMEYSISNFVTDTLVTHSGLTVLWAISNLLESDHSQGNIYLPEVDLYKSFRKRDSKKEIDLIAIVGGKYYAGEVKYTITDLLDSDGEVGSFLEKINLLRPDVAFLAFETYRHPNQTEDIQSIKNRLNATIETLKLRICRHTEFQFVVAAENSEFNEFPHKLGPWGKRTFSLMDSIPE